MRIGNAGLVVVLGVGLVLIGGALALIDGSLDPAGILVSMNLLLMGGSLVTLAVTSITTSPPKV